MYEVYRCQLVLVTLKKKKSVGWKENKLSNNSFFFFIRDSAGEPFFIVSIESWEERRRRKKNLLTWDLRTSRSSSIFFYFQDLQKSKNCKAGARAHSTETEYSRGRKSFYIFQDKTEDGTAFPRHGHHSGLNRHWTSTPQ